MPVFYRGRSAYITQEVFEALHPDRRSFTIRELSAVHVVHEPTGGLMPLALMIGIGIGAILLAAVTARSMWMVLVLAVVLSSTIALGSVRNAPAYELRALYRGRVVRLLRTGDRRVLGQVTRALGRAVEWNLDRCWV
jgi:hypothetical protein